MHILVTGGAGYLGSIMVPELLGDGHSVTVLDNFLFRQNSLASVCAHPAFDVVNGDARDEAVLKPLAANADVVIPLAALVGAPLCKRDQTGAISTNRDAIFTLLKLLSREQRVLMPVTNSGYGIGEKGKLLTEDHPLNPISLYGRLKVEAETAVLERGNAISFRLATVFGMAPRMRTDLLVNDFVYRAVYDGFIVLFEAGFHRNYIHIRDVAGAFRHALTDPNRMKDAIYNVGLSDANLSKRELCERIKAHVPNFVILEAPVGEDPDKRDYTISNARIEATGWRAQHSLDAGIKELIKGYRMIRDSLYANI